MTDATQGEPTSLGGEVGLGEAGCSVAIIGLGEVGRIYGTALHAAGHAVVGHDRYRSAPVDGITVVDTSAAAVADADVIFILTSAAASQAVANEVVHHMKANAVYADFTSSAPEAKRGLKDIFERRPDLQLADVAILGPVVQLGVRAPLMAAGPGTDAVFQLMTPLGAEVEVVDGDLGDAMAHKLLRSVFMKGLAAAVTEAVTAGRAANFEPWIREQIARELAGDGHRTINRFLEGSVLHAGRRANEMDDAAGYLAGLGVDATMARAAAAHLRQLTS